MKEDTAVKPLSYKDIAAINVNEHTEKRGQLTYLSWSWAVDRLLRMDENAMWSYGPAQVFTDGTMMIYCTVEAFGKARTAQLPVMDHKFKAIPNPDAFQVNVAMQRCLAKAIALHGLGLYIFSGEDLPPKDVPAQEETQEKKPALKSVATPTPASDQSTPKESDAPSPPTTPTGTIVVPSEIEAKGEAAVVDFIADFVQVFVPTVMNIDALREFWKINRAELSRVQRFSQPKYEQLETLFKQRAGELSK